MAQSVGRRYTLVICFEEIVVRNPKSTIFFFIMYSLLAFVCGFTIYTYFALVKVLKLYPVASRLPRRKDHLLHRDSALMRDNVLFDMPVSLLASSL